MLVGVVATGIASFARTRVGELAGGGNSDTGGRATGMLAVVAGVEAPLA
jgi:hypothetical protein